LCPKEREENFISQAYHFLLFAQLTAPQRRKRRQNKRALARNKKYFAGKRNAEPTLAIATLLKRFRGTNLGPRETKAERKFIYKTQAGLSLIV